MIKHRKFIICILLFYALFIVGIYDVRALNFDNLTDIQLVRVNVQGNRVNSATTNFSDFDSNYFENYSLTTGTITLPSGDYKLHSDYVYFSLGVFANLGSYEIDNNQIGADYNVQVIDFSANIGIDTNVGYVYCDYNTDSGIAFCPFNSIGATNITRVHVTFDFSKYSNYTHNGIHYGYLYGTDWYFCNSYSKKTKDSTQDIADNTKDINDTMNDSSIDNNNTSSSTTSWGNKNASNGTITNLLTLPISLLQAIVNGIQSSCSSFSLGSLFGTNIVLPCINIGSLIGSALWSTIDILFSGFMILAIAKKLIKIFNDFTNLKTNQVDELYGGGK